MFNIEKIKQLVTLLEESQCSKLHIREGEFEISLEKSKGQQVPEEVSYAPVIKAPEVVTSEAPDASSYITSPMVGTFFMAPSPDRPPFVKIGDMVLEDTIVCILEAMKVMNEVKAGCRGKVVEVLIKNGQPVEFGTKLFRVV